mgnify:CR=1 FL=1
MRVPFIRLPAAEDGRLLPPWRKECPVCLVAPVVLAVPVALAVPAVLAVLAVLAVPAALEVPAVPAALEVPVALEVPAALVALLVCLQCRTWAPGMTRWKSISPAAP